MRILALNAYHGGSHRAFLEGWMEASVHQFTTLTLPPYKWKWRMRHAAVTFASQVTGMLEDATVWDVVFCTDMMNLAEFRGLVRAEMSRIPSIAYFHENQLTYPSQSHDERDLHFAFTNMISAVAADAVWFNSAFHRDEFLSALAALLARMPDNAPVESAKSILAKSSIHYPGIQAMTRSGERAPGPIRILWASRWEHDKDPETFFTAIEWLVRAGCDFRLNVLGENFRAIPGCFGEARERFASKIDNWGHLKSRDDYHRVLSESDVIISTAKHEFFGIAMIEAVAAGCLPIVPRRLAYPEVLGDVADCFYDGTSQGLAERLLVLSKMILDGRQTGLQPTLAEKVTRRFGWRRVARQMDEAVVSLVESARG